MPGMLEALVSEDTLFPTPIIPSTAVSLLRGGSASPRTPYSSILRTESVSTDDVAARSVTESFANTGNTFKVEESSSTPGSKSGSLTKKGTLFPIIRSDLRASHIPPPLSSSISAEPPVATYLPSVSTFGWTSPGLLRLSPVAPSLSPVSLQLIVRSAGAPQVARAESLGLLGLPTTEELDDNDSPTVVSSQASSRAIAVCDELEAIPRPKTLIDEENAIFSGGIIEGGALLAPMRSLPLIRQRRMGYS